MKDWYLMCQMISTCNSDDYFSYLFRGLGVEGPLGTHVYGHARPSATAHPNQSNNILLHCSCSLEWCPW